MVSLIPFQKSIKKDPAHRGDGKEGSGGSWRW